MSSPQRADTIRHSANVPRREPMDLAFLSRFTYSSVIATFRALNTAHLPFFYGTSLRGALGHRIPLSHPLFVSAYKEEPDGQARPLIISPRLPPAWESIMAGGPVVLPFAVSTPDDRLSLPSIGAALTPLAPGSTIHVRFTLLGRFAPLLGDVIAFLAKGALRVGEVSLQLVEVRDGFEAGPVVWTQAARFHSHPQTHCFSPLLQIKSCQAARILLLTPLSVNSTKGGRQIRNFGPAQLLELMLVRAIRLFDAFQSEDGDRLPWMELPEGEINVASSRLFGTAFERISHYQERSMILSGTVGHIDLEGNVGPYVPLLAAAQILHAGQKASMGLGQIRCLLAH
jgi:hypothetical protein